jgi:hypothetical protein
LLAQVVALSSAFKHPKSSMEVVMARVPSSEHPPRSELDQLRAQNAELEQRLTEMQRTISIYAAASRILWTCAADERERGGGER